MGLREGKENGELPSLVLVSWATSVKLGALGTMVGEVKMESRGEWEHQVAKEREEMQDCRATDLKDQRETLAHLAREAPQAITATREDSEVPAPKGPMEVMVPQEPLGLMGRRDHQDTQDAMENQEAVTDQVKLATQATTGFQEPMACRDCQVQMGRMGHQEPRERTANPEPQGHQETMVTVTEERQERQDLVELQDTMERLELTVSMDTVRLVAPARRASLPGRWERKDQPVMSDLQVQLEVMDLQAVQVQRAETDPTELMALLAKMVPPVTMEHREL